MRENGTYGIYFSTNKEGQESGDIKIFYFTSFNESWKVGSEGDVGTYWKIWNKEEKIKY